MRRFAHVALQLEIHIGTLRLTIRSLGTRGMKGRIADDSRGGGGVKAYLPSEVEEEIANCLKILGKNGFGLSGYESVMQNWLETGLITETAVSVTERGWMETTQFHNWLRDVFLKNIGPQRPILLIYDDHFTYISVELINLAQENQVTLMKLPPHTTRVLQPLDVTVFKGLKINKVAKEVPSASSLNGFATTGIYNPKIQIKTTDLKRYNEQLQCSKPLPITEGELNGSEQGKQSGKEPEGASNEKKSNKEDLEKKSAEKKPEKEGNEKED
ncbi:hypothetical protein ILUMI_02041 [Ignelater luminosus]|uniref:DDE-1 domain-containing protein n=1 Tax=Ignelater luminosus TaxID=2038154 RepID=A0A8K0GJN6_IGNLU|nr:hypothetical protein ILUMI_02041 [Ignelater luminosus]